MHNKQPELTVEVPLDLALQFNRMVIPIVMYGGDLSVKVQRSEGSSGVRKALIKVQRLACLNITGTMRSCPTIVMEVIIRFTCYSWHVAFAAIQLMVKRANTQPVELESLPMAGSHYNVQENLDIKYNDAILKLDSNYSKENYFVII